VGTSYREGGATLFKKIRATGFALMEKVVFLSEKRTAEGWSKEQKGGLKESGRCKRREHFHPRFVDSKSFQKQDRGGEKWTEGEADKGRKNAALMKKTKGHGAITAAGANAKNGVRAMRKGGGWGKGTG